MLRERPPHVAIRADERHGGGGPVEDHPLEVMTQRSPSLCVDTTPSRIAPSEADELQHVLPMRRVHRLRECNVGLVN